MPIGEWLTGRMRNAAVDRQADESRRFLLSLQGMHDHELGMLLLWATHFRHQLAEGGYDLLDPIALVAQHPTICQHLSLTIRDFQRQKRLADAAAMMVWLHTLRGAIAPELRLSARHIWQELMRGAWQVPAAYSDVLALYSTTLRGTLPRSDGYETIPIGFEPAA